MNSITTIQIIALITGTIFLLIISRKSLLKFEKHGFYRFFVFEFCFILVLINIRFWIRNPFSPLQILSWVLLIISLFLVHRGFNCLKKYGGNKERENESSNFYFENTNYLVKDGIYKYIRHPMYSSLLFLCLGTFLKNISIYSIPLTAIVILFLFLTARAEEKENIRFFGRSYSEYIQGTKMFVPFIF